MKRTALVVSLVVSLGACKQEQGASPTPVAEHERLHASSPPAPQPSQEAVRPRPAALTHVTLKALGMHCEESCPLRVRYALADIPAVYELGFDVSTESIFVSYDAALGPPDEVTRPMLAAIKSAGYDPWLSKESWPEGASADVVQ